MHQQYTRRFRLIGKPFEGGYGVVYKAVEVGRVFDAYYAIKFARYPDNPDCIKRLKREARILSVIEENENIVFLHEANFESSCPYLVLEYIDGGTLLQALSNKTLNYTSVMYMASSIASALRSIHRNGGFHRDIKPENILLTSDGEFVLSDFGLAGDPSYTSFTQNAGGTPRYMEPHRH